MHRDKCRGKKMSLTRVRTHLCERAQTGTGVYARAPPVWLGTGLTLNRRAGVVWMRKREAVGVRSIHAGRVQVFLLTQECRRQGHRVCFIWFWATTGLVPPLVCAWSRDLLLFLHGLYSYLPWLAPPPPHPNLVLAHTKCWVAFFALVSPVAQQRCLCWCLSVGSPL